jgi:hypothetical protein
MRRFPDPAALGPVALGPAAPGIGHFPSADYPALFSDCRVPILGELAAG